MIEPLTTDIIIRRGNAVVAKYSINSKSIFTWRAIRPIYRFICDENYALDSFIYQPSIKRIPNTRAKRA